MPITPADLLRTVRTSAGLSQRQLARRAGTTQSVVARIERGATSPTWETITRLLAVAGFELEPMLRIRAADASHMLSDVPRILSLTPEARLIELRNVSRLMAEATRSA